MGRLGWVCLIVVGMMDLVPGWGQGVPVRVSGGVMAGQIVERTDPVYLPIAKAAKVTGAVVLRAIVDETGHVANLQVVSGPEMLRSAAMEAVRRWVFNPYLLNGTPRAVDTVVTVNFQLGPPVDRPGTGGPGEDGRSQAMPYKQMLPKDREPAGMVAPVELDEFCGSAPMGALGYHQRVSGGVMQGLVATRVDPVYPPGHHVGAVVTMVCVDANGAVEKVRVISGPEDLRDAVGRAVSEWRYRPYLLNGKAVPVSTTVIFRAI